LFVDYKIKKKLGRSKEGIQGSRGEGIYKDNNNNSIISLMQKTKIEWKMETMIAPSNKHQSPSSNQG
jgi:hypothetical protein